MTNSTSPINDTELLPSRIKRYLIELIVSGELAPGERIVESRLAKELQTSQSPVREALRDLAAIGLVELLPHRGSRVRSPDAKELADVSILRATLDSLAAEIAAELISPEQVARLDQLLEEMRTAAATQDMNAFATADAAFHEVISRSTDNQPLQRVLQQLEPFGRTYVTLLLPNSSLSEIIADHEAILAGLIARSPIEAASAASEHQHRMARVVLADRSPDVATSEEPE